MPLSALAYVDPAPQPFVDAALLATLRVQWARCRCLPRCDLFSVPDPAEQDLGACALALLRALQCFEALGGLRLYQPGTAELSFDEKWLLAVVSACATKDTDSLGFLLMRRLKPVARRQIVVRVMALSRALVK